MTDPIQFVAPSRARQDLLLPEHDEHVWIATAIYRMAPTTLRGATGGQLNLDIENFVAVEVGCWVCEQPYSDRLSYRKCPGEPGA